MLLNFLQFNSMVAYTSTAFPEPLSPEEEEKYIDLMLKGDTNARNILIEHNLRLVAHVAKKYTNYQKDSDELISIGTVGLIKGISTYKNTKGSRLATYTARCIDNEILMYLRSAKKLQNNISLQSAVGIDKEGNEVTLEEKLADPTPSVEETLSSNAEQKVLQQMVLGQQVFLQVLLSFPSFVYAYGTLQANIVLELFCRTQIHQNFIVYTSGCIGSKSTAFSIFIS